MDLMLLRTFQRQVEFQLKALLTAHSRLMAALAYDGDDWLAAMDEIWFSLENLLSAAANASKALWGSNPGMQAARQPLRDSLSVTDDSPLSNRRMRNHFEHYDERVEKWWKESTTHSRIDRIIGPLGSIGISGLTPLDMFRHLDPSTMDVTFWGDTFSIADLVDEASRLLPIAQREVAKPHWEP